MRSNIGFSPCFPEASFFIVLVVIFRKESPPQSLRQKEDLIEGATECKSTHKLNAQV